MANVIKLRKGLDINLTGKASKDVTLPVARQASMRSCLQLSWVLLLR